jgi:hypothetical protein
LAYLALGEKERAVEWIRRTVESGASISEFENSPAFDPLRQEPSYLQLKESIE